MALDEDLIPLHEFSECGKQRYYEYLEKKADEIIFKHKHPLKWVVKKIKEALKNG